jgi:hypothetical protein
MISRNGDTININRKIISAMKNIRRARKRVTIHDENRGAKIVPSNASSSLDVHGF